MTDKYVILDANDLVLIGGMGNMPDGSPKVVRLSVDYPVPGVDEVGITFMCESAALAGMMRVGDVLVPRPVSPQPYVQANTIIVPPCPAGTIIYVFDLLGAELMAQVVADTDDFAEVITFSDSGEFEVEVHTPSPHLFSRQKVML